MKKGGLLPLEQAQARLIALAAPLASENVALDEAVGRYLAADLIAKRDQPAADMSAMDGYAVRFADGSGPWRLSGQSQAGHAPSGTVAAAQAMRIFTGALMPEGADTIVIQENVAAEGDAIRLIAEPPASAGQHVRHQASDFAAGSVALRAGSLLNPAAIGHAVIAGHAAVPVVRQPKVAIISNGDELVAPGEPTLPHQIPASNDVMLSALLADITAETRMVSRVSDDISALCQAFDSARDCDIIVTIGGASVGDHDLILPALQQLGADIDFYKVAMRPGKPVMAGKLGSSVILALPGNPASAFVSATIFLLPLIRYMAGAAKYLPHFHRTNSIESLPANGPRAQFLRAIVDERGIAAFASQDSAKLSVLAGANALLYRPAMAPAVAADAMVPYLII